MRMSLLCSVASVFLATTAAFAQGEGEFPATLKGHAVLPAQPSSMRLPMRLTTSRPRANTPPARASTPSAA